jgi:hypothetical protein
MSKSFTNAIATGRRIADGLMHFAIGSVVAFGGATLALPILMQALRTAGVA